MNDFLKKDFNALHLPDGIGNVTLNELMNHPDTEIVKRGNKLSIRRQTDEGVATVEFASFDTGRREIRTSSVPHRELKRDYTDDILQMKREGMLQKDIAFELGLSPSYVSYILRNNR